jgi:CRP/FNR family transcriptional regulator, cyclic AMP receptor protein
MGGLLSGYCPVVRFEAGQIIFRQGEAANQFYLVREGKLAIEVFAAERGALTILTVGPGEVLGWSWLVPPYRWKFDACALEATRAIALDGKCLLTKAEQDHDLGYELLRRIAQVMDARLHATRLQLMNVYEIELLRTVAASTPPMVPEPWQVPSRWWTTHNTSGL